MQGYIEKVGNKLHQRKRSDFGVYDIPKTFGLVKLYKFIILKIFKMWKIKVKYFKRLTNCVQKW